MFLVETHIVSFLINSINFNFLGVQSSKFYHGQIFDRRDSSPEGVNNVSKKISQGLVLPKFVTNKL